MKCSYFRKSNWFPRNAWVIIIHVFCIWWRLNHLVKYLLKTISLQMKLWEIFWDEGKIDAWKGWRVVQAERKWAYYFLTVIQLKQQDVITNVRKNIPMLDCIVCHTDFFNTAIFSSNLVSLYSNIFRNFFTEKFQRGSFLMKYSNKLLLYLCKFKSECKLPKIYIQPNSCLAMAVCVYFDCFRISNN